MLDETLHQATESWIESANGHAEFPLQNLPIGVFSHADRDPRLGVAIGHFVFDAQEASRAGLLSGIALDWNAPASASALLGDRNARSLLRHQLFDLLRRESKDRARIESLGLLHAREACRMHL